jgi:hypothetical protein
MNATTKPGDETLRGGNAAIMKEGYYKDIWKFGVHHRSKPAPRQHPALVDELGNPYTIYRDPNNNESFDLLPAYERSIVGTGIHLHRAGWNYIAQTVDTYSAGCQVIQDFKLYEDLLNLFRLQISHCANIIKPNPNRFSYILTNSSKLS